MLKFQKPKLAPQVFNAGASRKSYVIEHRLFNENVLTQLTNVLHPDITDLVELVQFTDTPDQARTAVMKYLRKFPGKCPSPRCSHDLEQTPYLCRHYRFRWHTLQMVQGKLKSSPSKGYALSTQEICTVLRKTEDPRKEHCHECGASDRPARGKMDGIYCHGCGFFIDFGRKQIGYTQEWTVSERSKNPFSFILGNRCSNCAQSNVKAKFADYFFCSQACLNQWFSEPKSAP